MSTNFLFIVVLKRFENSQNYRFFIFLIQDVKRKQYKSVNFARDKKWGPKKWRLVNMTNEDDQK